MAALLGVCVVAPPGVVAVAWCAVGLVSAGAIVAGVRLRAPLRRVPWWLLAASVVAMTAGDVAFGVVTDAGDTPAPAPGILANLCYLAMFPLTMAGFAMLTRASVVFRDRARLLDLLTVGCAVAVVAWVFLVGPSLDSPRLDNVARSLTAGYLLGDLVLVLVTVRLAVAARRSAAVLLLTTGAAGLLTSNVAYAWLQLGDGWRSCQPAVLGYVVLYVTWGAAALHPSMTELTAPVDVPPRYHHGRWAIWLRLCLAVPALVLLAQSLKGRIRDGVVVAVASILMCELVVSRLSDMVGRHRRAVARERGLREACGALVAAVDDAAVVTAVRVAVGQLLPPGVEHRVMVVIRPDCAASDDTAVTAPAPGAGRDSRLLRTRLLHPRLRDALGGSGTTLVCRLDAHRSVAEGTGHGMLLVSAPGAVLETIRDSLEVLAAQTTMAVDRIMLNDVISRRDGDRYLRSVVQNTEDVVLVVDHDDRLRYASPSLSTVLGVDPAACAAVRDVIAAEDREQVAQTRARAERLAGAHGDAGAAGAGTGGAGTSGAWAGGAGAEGGSGGVRDLWSLRRPDGRRVLVEVSYRDLRADRMVRGFVITLRDVTEQRRHEQEVVRQALRHSGGWQNRMSSLHRFR